MKASAILLLFVSVMACTSSTDTSQPVFSDTINVDGQASSNTASAEKGHSSSVRTNTIVIPLGDYSIKIIDHCCFNPTSVDPANDTLHVYEDIGETFENVQLQIIPGSQPIGSKFLPLLSRI